MEFKHKFYKWAGRRQEGTERGVADQTAPDKGEKQGEVIREVDWELVPELLDGGQGKETVDTLLVTTEEGRDTLLGTTEEGRGREPGEDIDTRNEREIIKWDAPPGVPPEQSPWGGLQPPRLKSSGTLVTGATKEALRRQNARERKALLAVQQKATQWTTHLGAFMPSIIESVERREGTGGMCPQRLALLHPAASLLEEWATFGCPAMTGRDWTHAEMAAAIARGPHKSALSPEAIMHFAAEATEKVACGQARIVNWDDIKENPPQQLKISPIAAIPHKSKAYRSILDLSFRLRLSDGGGGNGCE